MQLIGVRALGASNAELTFSGPIVILTGSHAFDSSITVNGNQNNNVSSPAGNKCNAGFNAVVNVGDVWATHFQPPWLKNPLIQPNNGLVT